MCGRGRVTLASVGAIALSIGVVSPGLSDSGAIPPRLPDSVDVQQANTSQLQNLAQSITVKVISGQTWGSGILFQRQGQTYTVVTNRHVLNPSNTHSIQTPDGGIYSATAIEGSNFDGNDLGLLQFSSPNDYPIPSLNHSLPLAVGDEVFAAGFPFEGNPGFTFKTGQVSLLMDKAFNGGYQIGYTNSVEKGMSGGPLLNRQGVIVGINGMHAYPLWGNPYVFSDGSAPAPSMQEQMSQLSWAIPLQTFLIGTGQAVAPFPMPKLLPSSPGIPPLPDPIIYYPPASVPELLW